MKYWIPCKWDIAFEHEGLLFFVQKMQEMLFHYSDDIHRAPVHNTVTLADEFLKTNKEVIGGQVKKYMLKPIFEEFKFSFEHDSILRKQLGSGFVDSISLKMKSCSESEKHSLVTYIREIIKSDYLSWVISYLKEHIPQKSHKQEIEKGARCWISEIIAHGYSGEYVYNYIEKNLVLCEVKSLEILNQFFSRFDFEEKSYKVYFQLSNSIASYSDILEKRLSLRFDNDGNFGLIQQYKNHVLCFFEIEAVDYYQAVSLAYLKISVFLKFYRFISNKRKNVLNKFGAVWDSLDEKMYFLPAIPTGFKSIEVKDDDITVILLDSVILGIQNKNGNIEMKTLSKAIELHNSALNQQLPKDGFISLWSIFEILCPLTDDDLKIDMVLDSVLPILQNDYFQAVFHSILSDLSMNLSNGDFKNLQSIISGDSDSFKVAAFCLLPEYEKLREEYFEKMPNLPLLRYKIFNLYRLNQSKRDFFELSDQYAQRVKWHLFRLYRIRNAIVHSGTAHPRIQILGEHLHSYVDNVMNEIAFKLSENQSLSSINNIFVDTKFLLSSKRERFLKDGGITDEDIKHLQRKYFIMSSLATSDKELNIEN